MTELAMSPTTRKSRRFWAPLPVACALMIPAVVLVLGVLCVPLLRTLSQSLLGATGAITLDNFRTLVASRVETHALLLTLSLSAITTGACVILGVPFAFSMTLARGRLAKLLLLAVTLPFWTALLVRTYAWLMILQRHGVLSDVRRVLGLGHEPLALVNNMTGTLIGMIHIMLPVFILPVHGAIRQVDANLIRAALSLGANHGRVCRTVLLPLASGGIVSGALLVFVSTLGFFVTPAVLGGGNVSVLSGRIARNITAFDDWGTASALGVALLVLVGASLLGAYLVGARLTRRSGGLDV